MHHPSRIHMPQGAFALFFIGALYYHLWHQLLKHMIVHVNDRVDVWKRVLSYIVTALYFAHYLVLFPLSDARQFTDDVFSLEVQCFISRYHLCYRSSNVSCWASCGSLSG